MHPAKKREGEDTPYVEPRPFSPDCLRPRRTRFSFDLDDVPNYWVGGSPARTHLFNSINVFLVPFEEFMVRVLSDQGQRLDDPELRRQIRGFCGQEANHARAHQIFLDTLRAQGHDVDGFLHFADAMFSRVLERGLGRDLSLAAIAGFEHLTAFLAEFILDGEMLAQAPPALQELWKWHAAEELEHKALAFDLLRHVNGSYPLRIAGGALGAGIVFGFLGIGMALLFTEEGILFERRTLRETLELFFTRDKILTRSIPVMLDYLRPGFHPSQRDTRGMAERMFAQVELQVAEDVPRAA
ncbi:uncharacterized protein CMC5_030740 [Chondromyces crocatus]|uniref:Metal-dependent hydrolase n=2 Tax=Chondromyces crocatus TaxID=52 RepID=A0A0K1EE00_CHOCO|nr:uncharacterized protein CMC5_030740 [Chondromyces crocatus]